MGRSLSLRSLAYILFPQRLHSVLQKIETSDIGSRLIKGVFWSMAGSVVSRGLMLCATILVARMLGKTGYGEFSMIQSTVGFFGVLAGFRLGLMANKYVAELRNSDPARAGRIIGLSSAIAALTGGVMAAGLLVFAPWLAEHTLNAPHLADVLRVGAIMLFLNAINGAQTGTLAGFEVFRTIAYVNLFVGLVSFPILVAGAYFGGLPGAVGGLAVNLCFNWLFNQLALRREAKCYNVPLSFNNCQRERSVLISFSLPVALSSIVVPPAMWGCRALLANQPNGYDELGIFAAAIIFQMPLLFIGGTVSTPLLSMVSNAGESISDKMNAVNILSSWIIGVTAAVPLLCFPEITQVLLGRNFAGYDFKVTFSIVIFYTCITLFLSGLSRTLVARNLLWWGFFSNLFWALVLIPSALFFIQLGAIGLAASFAIAYVLNVVVLLPPLLKKNLVKKEMLFSRNSLLIWFVLFFLVLLNILGAPLSFRAIVFLPCVLSSVALFRQIARNAL